MRRQATAQASDRSCAMKGGVNFMAFLLRQASARRSHLRSRRGTNNSARDRINRYHAHLPHHTVSGTGKNHRNNPKVFLGQREPSWNAPDIAGTKMQEAILMNGAPGCPGVDAVLSASCLPSDACQRSLFLP